MEDFLFEPVWQLGEGGLHEEPYFDLTVGFYHFINEDQIGEVVEGFIGYVHGRLAVVYGFEFHHQEHPVGQRQGR